MKKEIEKKYSKILYIVLYISFFMVILQNGVFARLTSKANSAGNAAYAAKFDIKLTQVTEETDYEISSLDNNLIKYEFEVKNDSDVKVSTLLELTFDKPYQNEMKLVIYNKDNIAEKYEITEFENENKKVKVNLKNLTYNEEVTYIITFINEERIDLQEIVDYEITPTVTVTQIN